MRKLCQFIIYKMGRSDLISNLKYVAWKIFSAKHDSIGKGTRFLPCDLSVDASGNLQIAQPASIISASRDYVKTLYSYYTQVILQPDLNFARCYKSGGMLRFEPWLSYHQWADLGFLEVRYLYEDSSGFPSPLKFCDFIKRSIDQGYCVHALFDEYFIPRRESFFKRRFSHLNGIVGYDFNRGIFRLIGYYGGKFDAQEIPIDLVIGSAFSKGYETKEYVLYRPNLDTEDRFDIDLFRMLLRDYLCANDPRENAVLREWYSRLDSSLKNDYREHTHKSYMSAPWVCGYDIYDELISYYATAYDSLSSLNSKVSLALWDHKSIMKKRLSFFKSKRLIAGNLFMEYERIEKTARIIRFAAFEYNSENSSEKRRALLSRILGHLKELKSLEKSILERVLASIQNVSSVS